MSNVQIKACACESQYQDKMYGKNIRVHNVGKSGTLKCTVCGNKKNK